MTIPRISHSTLDCVCHTLADAASHKELTLLLAQAGIDELGGTPKWERMLLALLGRQEKDQCGNNVLSFLCTVLHPTRFDGRLADFEDFRAKTNYQLSFYGLSINDQGKPAAVAPATTISEAQERASKLKTELLHRSIHPDVLKFCKVELLQDNYFHCVLEASKSVAQKIRDRSGIEADGAPLVDLVFSVRTPVLALNSLRTESEQSEQKGFANMLKGVFGTFRNVTAHAPKIHWAINHTDAMDALTIFSYLHRRLDGAVVVPQSTNVGST